MKIDVLLGLQWGDEGKGKIVDVLTPNYQIIARFQGGPNAGHTLEFNNKKHILHLIPSGVFRENTENIIGNGVVIDPSIFKKELDELAHFGINYEKTILISKKAHLILPTHRILDAASEAAKGKEKIGSTLRGIGPAYMDKTGRNGLRVGDILSPDFNQKYQKLIDKHLNLLKNFDYKFNLEEFSQGWMEGIEAIKKCRIIDSECYINQQINQGKRLLAEGAQGTLLDLDFGSYPFVTSSSTVCAGACTGLGIAPNRIGEVFGIFKAYCTRVGSGPFPTELNCQTGENLRKLGHEFGATTGRPRRTGYLDLVALRYSVMINGVTQLIMTKADVLNTFEQIKVATAYKINNEIVETFPYDISVPIEPIYKEFHGWNKDICEIKDFDNLPIELLEYIKYIEYYTGVPVNFVSTGPEREAIVCRKK